MGTKIEPNAFLREHHSVIDLGGSTMNGMMSFYNENRKVKNNEGPGLFTSYDLEKVRHTILEHESIFKNQLQELHRLYGRQRQLMNEIKTNMEYVKVQKCRSSYSFSLNLHEDAKRPWYPYHYFPTSGATVSLFPPTQDKSSLRICEPRVLNGMYNVGIPADVYSRNVEKQQASGNRDDRFCLSGVQTSQRKAGSSAFDLCFKRNSNPGERGISNATDGVSDRLTLSRGDVCPDLHSSFNPVAKDFFQHSSDGKNRENSPSILGLRGESSRKEQLSDCYAEKRRLERHSSVGGFCSSSKPLLAEPKKEFTNCPLDIGASVSRKRKKIFGVEIPEENHLASNKSCKLDQKPSDENKFAFSLESSSWIASSFVQNLDLRGSNLNDGKSDRSKADLPAEISKKESEHTRPMIPPEGGLIWFLRNSQVSDDLSKEKKNSYFMNLDSLQNCSKKFFGKGEMPDDTILQASKQKEETAAAPMAPHGGTNEANDGTWDLNCGENLETNGGFKNSISDLRHCIDLNLSLDEEDAPSAPSLPTATVKIATTEIDLEAPAVIESESDAPHKEAEPKIMARKSEFPSKERDKVAAEAMIAISLSTEKTSVDDDSLKWFAEIVSSQCGDSSNVLVDVSKNRSPTCEEEEEEGSVPDGMDYFEFMTLKLEDKGEEKHYHHEQPVLNDPSIDEVGPTQTKRLRRGQSRRGRQRKDFQRDTLPGLITLSRLEVKEDFQAFEELLKAEGGRTQSGSSHRGSVRNGRGKKRPGGANTSPGVKTGCSAQAEQPVYQLEQRSLAGWGKRTRRLPRQRCPNALLSFPVKC